MASGASGTPWDPLRPAAFQSVGTFAAEQEGLSREEPVINFGEELRAAIDAVDPQLHHFFSVVVNSFIRLELVVYLRQSGNPGLTELDIVRELGWPEDRVSEELNYLVGAGVLECDGGEDRRGYRISSDPRVTDLVNKFSFLYANRSSRLLILGHLLREGNRA